jgi:cystathionine gamma-synthase
MRIETRAIHAGRRIDPATGAVALPIHLTSTFERSAEGEYPLGFSYSREQNPVRRALEECLASLEGGKEALAFSSGLAVATAIFQGLEPGDHILIADDVYWALRKVAGDVFARSGFEVEYVDVTDPEILRSAMRPSTRLIWVETPSNPLMKITDLAAVAAIAREP